MRLIVVAVLLVTTSAALAQSAGVWQPPTLDLPDTLPQATVSKEMITKLQVSQIPIILEETDLIDIQKILGGTIGSRGDASEALQWLCFQGSDLEGRWILWLESSEMGGDTVDGFAWQRTSKTATLDSRCRTQNVEVDLPIRLGIGLTESEVRRSLGVPTAKYRNTLIFHHEHQRMLRGKPLIASNIIFIVLRRGMVWAVQV